MTATVATVTLLHDASPGGTGKLYVTATVDGTDYELGSYTEMADAAQRMRSWVVDRGLDWAPGSAARVDACVRTDGPVLTLDVWPKADVDTYHESRITRG